MNIKTTCTFHNKIISRWMQSRECCLFGYSSYCSIKMGCKWCFVDLKLFWTFLMDEFDLWLIFLSDRYLKGSRMVLGILSYACKACQVHWRAGPVHQTNLLPAGERDGLVLHLTLILAGKCSKVLCFVHISPHLLHSLPIILLPTDDT